MQKPSYFTVDCKCENTIVISKSKFITTLVPISDCDDAIVKTREIAKRYGDATHNCYAYISNESATQQRFSDDGEPQGTAGIPMLDVLKKRGVHKTLAVVTRYFGGIKLGANGLVGAYSSSVSEALDRAKIVKMVWADIYRITLAYTVYKKVEEALISHGGKIENTDYSDDVTLTAALPSQTSKDALAKVVDITQGRAKTQYVESQYVGFDVIQNKNQ